MIQSTLNRIFISEIFIKSYLHQNHQTSWTFFIFEEFTKIRWTARVIFFLVFLISVLLKNICFIFSILFFFGNFLSFYYIVFFRTGIYFRASFLFSTFFLTLSLGFSFQFSNVYRKSGLLEFVSKKLVNILYIIKATVWRFISINWWRFRIYRAR